MNGDTTEVKGELSAWGSWITAPGELLNSSPALAANGTNASTLTGYALGSNNQIWVTTSNGSTWSGSWSQLSNPGSTFTSSPSAVGLDVPSGGLVNHFALAAMRSDNKYYVRVQNRAGSVVDSNWTAVGTMTFSTAPSITFVPASAGSAPKNSLVLAGVGNDGRMYWARNTLGTGNTYSASNWTGFSTVGTTIFVSAPAVTYSQNTLSGANSLILAGGSEDVNGNVNFQYATYSGTAWSSFTMLSGTFVSSPALAVGRGELLTREDTIYGVELDSKVYVAVIGGAFSAIGTQLSNGNPTAVGIGGEAYVGMRNTSSIGTSNSAFSP